MWDNLTAIPFRFNTHFRCDIVYVFHIITITFVFFTFAEQKSTKIQPRLSFWIEKRQRLWPKASERHNKNKRNWTSISRDKVFVKHRGTSDELTRNEYTCSVYSKKDRNENFVIFSVTFVIFSSRFSCYHVFRYLRNQNSGPTVRWLR